MIVFGLLRPKRSDSATDFAKNGSPFVFNKRNSKND